MLDKCKEPGCYSDGVCGDDRCPAHTKTRHQIKTHLQGKTKPRTALPHLGIELECYATSEAVYQVMLAQKVGPCRDGSLPNFGCEFKMCSTLRKLEKSVVDLAGRLAAAGATVNNRCGLHVHLDAREIGTTRIQEFLAWLETWQDWLFAIMPPSRRQNTFCRRLPVQMGYDHYHWANRTCYNTVEIRIHGGTLNPHKLVGWLHVCESLRRLLWSDEAFPTFLTNFESTSPTDAWMEKVFDAKAREYLRARERSNGVLASTVGGTPNGLTTETETN